MNREDGEAIPRLGRYRQSDDLRSNGLGSFYGLRVGNDAMPPKHNHPSCAPLFMRQLHLVTGKGGVGKSVFSTALALHFQRQGLRTLLVQVNAADSHSRLLGLPTGTIGEEVTEVSPNLFAVNTTPPAALKEYALLILHSELVYKAVFENRLVRKFLRFIPSLSELTMLGKIWFHAEEKHEKNEKYEKHEKHEYKKGAYLYDRIVVDCPSTGHGITFLQTAQAVRDASRSGPMYDKTVQMAQVLEDVKRTALHIVALPEEMPVNESIELMEKVRARHLAPLGIAAINQCLAPLLQDNDAKAALPALYAAAQERMQLADPHQNPQAIAHDPLLQLFHGAVLREQRELRDQEQSKRLAAHCHGMPVLPLPFLPSSVFGRAEVEKLSHLLTQAAARDAV